MKKHGFLFFRSNYNAYIETVNTFLKGGTIVKIGQMLKLGKDLVGKNSPTILTAAGVVLFGVTVYLAVKKTDKVKEILNEKKEAGATKMETARAVAPEVAAPVAAGAAAVACVLAANHISARRIATLGAAYSMTRTAFDEYKSIAKEELGEDKESSIKSKLAKKHCEENPMADGQPIVTDGGHVLFFDDLSGRYFRSSPNYVRKVVNELNKRAMDGCWDSISVNELYTDLGLDSIGIGDDFGWRLMGDGLIELDLGAHLTETDELCVVLDFDNPPRYIGVD